MVRFKIIFEDQGQQKRIDGDVDFNSDPQLIKVIDETGKVLYINKSKIVFLRELL